jgi:Spy/CpxP family protein refolding chaperone
MKHNKMFNVMALAAVVAMVAIAPLQAVPGCQKQGDAGKKMGMGCMMFQRLPNLSEEQKGKLETLQAEHQKLMAGAMAGLNKLAGEMNGLMKEPFEVAKIEAKIDEIAKARADMQKKCLAHRLAVRALLTPEQKAKFDEMGCGMAGGMMGCMMKGHGCMAGAMRHGHKMRKGECPQKADEAKKGEEAKK